MSTTPLKTTILTAPQAWGKTRNAEALRQEFHCSSVVDDWWPGRPLTVGALHLTNIPPGELRNNKPQLYQIVSRGWN